MKAFSRGIFGMLTSREGFAMFGENLVKAVRGAKNGLRIVCVWVVRVRRILYSFSAVLVGTAGA